MTMDNFTVKHMADWLKHEFGPEVMDTGIFEKMIEIFEDQPDYWGNQGYTALWEACFQTGLERQGFWHALRAAQDDAMDAISGE